MACDSPVYIRSSKLRGTARPLFQHYSGSDPDCPWYQGRNMRPDDARAAQYQGQQESRYHRALCDQIAELVALDPRHIRHSVSEYLPPTENKHGRFPDVFVEWRGFGSFAVEFQMSGTFQTEISARCNHYAREGIPLLWVLFGLERGASLSQNVVDVIRRHRGNAFALDPEAIEESRKQRTLVLSCYLRGHNGDLEEPRLVRFDQLTFPRSQVPYLEDRIFGRHFAELKAKRKPWFDALESWEENRYRPLRGLDRASSLLIAAAFSIVATANGRVRNYASDHPNISGMLNTHLHGGDLATYADLLSRLIENTNVRGKLKPTVFEHLKRYRAPVQVGEDSIEWERLRELLPEALDGVLRAELEALEALPAWAMP